MFDVSAATFTLNGGTPAPGRVISISSPARAPRMSPRDSGISAPRAGSSMRVPFSASNCCNVVSRGNASSDVAYRRLAWRTNTFADGTGSATATPSTAFSLSSSASFDRRGERDLRAHLLETRGGVERGLGRVDDSTRSDHADDRGGGRDGGDDRRARAEGVVATDAQQSADAERDPPTIAARRSPSSATPRLFAPTCSGRYTDSASSGPPIAAPTMPECDADHTRDRDGDRQRATTTAEVLDPGARQRAHQRGDHERDRRDHDARLAEAGELLLDHAVRRLRHTRAAPAARRCCSRVVVSRPSSALRSTPAS